MIVMFSSSLFSLSLLVEEEAQWHEAIASSIIYLSLPVFLTLYYVVPAPWGKLLLTSSSSCRSSSSSNANRTKSPRPQTRAGENLLLMLRGPRLPARFAWFLFESPNLVWAIYAWRHRRSRHGHDPEDSSSSLQLANYILFFLFAAHYLQRAIVYPYRMSPQSKSMPLVIVASALVYCSLNGYLQCRSLLYFHHFPEDWCRSVQFQLGLLLFAMGAYINLQSDGILRQLSRHRKMMLQKQQLQKQQQPGRQQQQLSYQSTTTTTRDDDYSYYQIPTGGWFDYCSSPHYFGEMVQWLGFCVACQWSLASTSFFLFTVANLLPRGVAQHDWYRHHFNGGISRNGNQLLYPPHRKAVIPFVW